MDREELETLRRIFVAETAEQLAEMEAALLKLEEQPEDAALVQAIFRVAHTVKGNASTVGMPALADYTHHLEGLLHRVRTGECPVTRDLVSLLLGALDVLRELASGAPDARLTAAQRSSLARIRRVLGRVRGVEAPAAPAPGTEAASAPAAASAGGQTLRIDVARLDRMLDLVGEIAVARGRVSQLLESTDPAELALARDLQRESDRLQSELQELVLKVRMVPIGPVFHQFARTVRDLARAHGKEARLLLDGEGVELDTSVVEPLKDALTHVLRNAVSHGIEVPERRRATGKEPCGTIRLRAAHEAGSVLIEVADDGAGLDRERIAARGRALGLLPAGAEADERQLAQLLFTPGFSTAEKVNELSGRGVGMDVVRRNVEALRGAVELSNQPGRGLAVTIRLPLTLAIIEGFVVTAGEARYVVPMDAVVECLDAAPDADGKGHVLPVRGAALPCLALRELFAIPGAAPARESVVVVSAGGMRAGILVDGLLGQAQLVLKPLSGFFRSVADVSGSAILGDGRVALVLDVVKVVRHAETLAASIAD